MNFKGAKMTTKVGVIGLGYVGAATSYQLVSRAMCDEIVLFDIKEDLAIAHAHDLKDALCLCASSVKIDFAKKIEELADCDVIVLSFRKAHFNSLATRLDELKNNASELCELVPPLKKAGFKGFYVIATNPNDTIVYYTQLLSALDKSCVIGSGTNLDSSRLRRILGEKLGLNPLDINAYMIGEHGDSQFAYISKAYAKDGSSIEALWQAQFNSKLDIEALEKEVANEGYFIYNKKGRTEYGIGSSCASLTEAILKNKRLILPVSSVFRGENTFEGYALSLPCLIGKNGIEKVFECEFNAREKSKLEATKKAIQEAILSCADTIKPFV